MRLAESKMDLRINEENLIPETYALKHINKTHN